MKEKYTYYTTGVVLGTIFEEEFDESEYIFDKENDTLPHQIFRVKTDIAPEEMVKRCNRSYFTKIKTFKRDGLSYNEMHRELRQSPVFYLE